MSESPLSILVVGDVFVDIDNGATAFRDVAKLLRQGDLVIGNNEGVYSDRPAIPPTVRHAMTAPLARGDCLGAVPFHMMSCANNHFLDGGYAGLEDTLGTLRRQGILTAGAGADAVEAFAPTIAERKGLKVALISVVSVFPVGYEARSERPGLAGLRVRTHYAVSDPTFWEPGLPAVISTEAIPEDMTRLEKAIADARQTADIVLVTCHWGISNTYRTLERYEIELASQVVDLGADAVFCCHHHSMRGVRYHSGKPIFQGLGTFVHHMTHHPSPAKIAALQAKFGEYAHGPREGYPLFPFHPLARKTGIASIEVGPDGQVAVGFFPGIIEPDGSTKLFSPGEAGAREVLDYLREVTAVAGFSTMLELGAWKDWAHISILHTERA